MKYIFGENNCIADIIFNTFLFAVTVILFCVVANMCFHGGCQKAAQGRSTCYDPPQPAGNHPSCHFFSPTSSRRYLGKSTALLHKVSKFSPVIIVEALIVGIFEWDRITH